MSGYIPREPWNWRTLTREQWLGFLLAMGAAALSIVTSVAAGRAAPALLRWMDLGSGRIGFILWIIAGAFLLQPVSGPDDPTIPRRTPRSRRLLALAFFLLGAVILGVALYTSSQGAL